MKKLIYIAFLASLAISCKKQLEQYPLSSKNLSTFLTAQPEAEEYITSVYGSLQSNGLYGLYMPAVGEVPSDNSYEEVAGNDSGIYSDLDMFKTVPVNGLISDIWTNSYQAIQKTNVVLARINNITYSVAATKNARIGEMKFIRALIYFNLVRIYGAVPLVTTETTDPNLYFGQQRSSVNDVYTLIKQDLNEAITMLPAATTQPGRVVKTAAQTLLGKVFLTLNEYQNAETQLQAVISSNVHSLQPIVSTVFPIANENNKEIIFAVQFASGINGNTEGSTMQQQFSPSGTIANAKGHNLPTKSLYNLFSSNDARKGVYIAQTNAGTPFCNKWTRNTAVPADGGSDYPVLRYADVLLMQAEVENELNKTTEALSFLNQVRTRAGLSNTSANTQVDIRAAIELERRLELVGEGHRWFDLLRTGKAITTMNQWFVDNNIPVSIGQKNLLMPIPQKQIDTDPILSQNPGY
ncbi:RagB/SusD family nutrient uptake outer membrane protein [Pedobacter sandarakinus]|uniref:RagB/SusD family nutrient uptake outer membrane protein n=1 Tax=Pedobacter sandarakinus TaxID=353156 RepID=UPI0022463C1C|nr:RagB/SusD family nutrient uptake outer membrane protein [Pedobacter sandarakinus]MCX2574589.1 RagB/SusD family nutrient uptake outer membrane protein [Pedobacter sandarakinus]